MFVIFFIDTLSEDLPINLSTRYAPDDVEVLNNSCLLTSDKLPRIITPSKRSFNQLTLLKELQPGTKGKLNYYNRKLDGKIKP